MTTTSSNTEKKPVMTMTEIALHYYEHNLDMCKGHIKEQISDCKKEQMALIVNDMESIFKSYVDCIKNIHDTERLSSLHELQRIWKLKLIEKIVKF